jgi:heptosyltransferase-2
MSAVVIYGLARPEHLKAFAEEYSASHPGCRLFLISQDPTNKPSWAEVVMSGTGALTVLRNLGAGGVDEFSVVVSNDPAYLRPAALLRAVILSLLSGARKRRFVAYAWSGRRDLSESAGEVMRKVLAFAFRPLFLHTLRLFRKSCGPMFSILNKKSRKTPYSPSSIGRVLVLSLDLVGDFVWNVPAIRAVKCAAPGTRVDLLVHPKLVPLASTIPEVDSVLGYDCPWLGKLHYPAGKRPGTFLKNFKTRLMLLLAGYDLVVDLRGEPRHAVLAYFTGAPFRVGFAGKPAGVIRHKDTSFLLTHDINASAGHVMGRALSVTGALGFTSAPSVPWLVPEHSAMTRIDRILKDAGVAGKLLIGIQPGASRTEKMWTVAGFAEVADALSGMYDARILLTGTSGEAGLASRIAEKATGTINLAGRTDINMYVAAIARCDLFICNESSAISISSAVKTPVVCLMTGVPEVYGPYGVPSKVLQRKPGCWDPVGEHCFCPYGYRCLQDITPEEVLDAAVGLLRETGRLA